MVYLSKTLLRGFVRSSEIIIIGMSQMGHQSIINLTKWTHRSFHSRITLWMCALCFILMPLTEVSSSVSFDYVPRPEFLENPTELNVTSYVDHTTRLPCTVRHLGTKRVSWIRRRDLQVLSSGRITFATDIRISVLTGTTSHKRYTRDVANSNQTSQTYEETSNRFSYRSVSGGQYYRNGKSKSDRMWSHRASNDHHEPPNEGKCYNKRHYRNGQHIYIQNSDANSRPTQGARVLPSRIKLSPLFGPNQDPNVSRSTKRKSEKGPKEGPKEGPILIHSSHEQKAADINDSHSKRTVVPYNYLEGVWEPEDYALQIKFTQRNDAGTYLCQINTEPRMSQLIRLNVVDMVAKILGRRELFVKAGSPVTLTCKVTHGTDIPGFIFWYKNDQLVDYDNSLGRVVVRTTAQGSSELLLRRAVPEDTANYTCAPSGGRPASAVLTVIADERPAAMQQGNMAPQLTTNSEIAGFLPMLDVLSFIFLHYFVNFLY